MGWFDGVSVVGDDRHSSGRHHSSSHRKHSSSASVFGLGTDNHRKHSTSAGSFFGLGSDNHKHHSSSRSSFFGGRSSSYYKRSPRRGFLNNAFHKLRRLFRELIHYMKRHPLKVFMLVIMPLITGGALTGLLRQFGIRLPVGVERIFSAMGGSASGIGRGHGGGLQFERESFEGPLGAMGAMGGLGSVMGGASGLMGVAKMFL